jgi:Zn-finger nucleic acid-binding protein
MVRFGEEEDWPKPTEGDRCPDCGVAPGGIHHPDCDIQQCPRCHGQIGGCGDDFDELSERFG